MEQTSSPHPGAGAFTRPGVRTPCAFELTFRAMSPAHCSFSFACDECGRVSMDALCESSRVNYLYARKVIGHEVHAPVVVLQRAG